MLPRQIESVEISSLQDLMDRHVEEHGRLEYKRGRPDTWKHIDKSEANIRHDKRREFLKDVTAMANADGGDILYGVDERKWEVSGFEEPNMDGLIRELSDMLLNHVQPSLRVTFQAIKVEAEAESLLYALICRVQASYRAPHMVNYNQQRLFFQRNNNKVSDMDYDDLRRAFGAQMGWAQTWEKHVERSIERVRHNNPVSINSDDAGRFLVKVAPLSSLYGYDVPDLAILEKEDYKGLSFMRGVPCTYPRYCLDGCYFVQQNQQDYLLLQRDGSIDLAGGQWIFRRGECYPHHGFGLIVATIQQLIEFYRTQHIQGPYLMTMRLLHTKGVPIHRNLDRFDAYDALLLTQDVMTYPTVFIEPEENVFEAMRHFYEIWFQSMGYSRMFMKLEKAMWEGILDSSSSMRSHYYTWCNSDFSQIKA